jgi:uncharacterized protein YuzE
MQSILANPDQIVEIRQGRSVFQSKVQSDDSSKMYLIRIFIDIDRKPPEVVTAYRTSKIKKYLIQEMKVIYDTKTDTLTIILKDAEVAESDEEKNGIVLDYDVKGDVISPEILDAKTRATQPMQMVYELAGQTGIAPEEVHV